MWVEPESNNKYRDPYWFIRNPIKRLKHLAFLYSVKHSLGEEGLNNAENVIN